jgi:hypothetical protein
MVGSARYSETEWFLEIIVGAMMLTTLFTRLSLSQDFQPATQMKGTRNRELWIGGVAAQHDGTTSFNTNILMGGARFGRVLTYPHGPGWLRGTLQWDFDVIPLFIVFNVQKAYGVEFDPIVGRWNFNSRGKSALYFEIAGGLVYTNTHIPPGQTSNFNVVPKIAFGWQIFRAGERSIDIGLNAWHLSNAWTGPRNPSANGIQLTLGYHWFKPKNRSAADRTNAGKDDDKEP